MSHTSIIQQGAEALIIREGDLIIKDRIRKAYRHPELDKKIIKTRTKKEAKLLEKASRLINAPNPSKVEFNEIEMPFIEGKKLSENLEQLDWNEICKTIGNQIAKLHDNNIIHGDLTTSNMIWQENLPLNKSLLQKNNAKQSQNNSSPDLIGTTKLNKTVIGEHEEPISKKSKLYFIDFGLGFISPRIEDKAVDLHLIKQALEAKHFLIHKEAEKIILDNYNSKDKTRVLEQLKKVEARGRYRKNAH